MMFIWDVVLSRGQNSRINFPPPAPPASPKTQKTYKFQKKRCEKEHQEVFSCMKPKQSNSAVFTFINSQIIVHTVTIVVQHEAVDVQQKNEISCFMHWEVNCWEWSERTQGLDFPTDFSFAETEDVDWRNTSEIKNRAQSEHFIVDFCILHFWHEQVLGQIYLAGDTLSFASWIGGSSGLTKISTQAERHGKQKVALCAEWMQINFD